MSSGGRLTVLLRHRPVQADVTGDPCARSRCRRAADARVIHAPYFLDATEQGDLLPLDRDRVRHWIRIPQADRRAACARRGAAGQYPGIHRCFAVDHLAGENHTIDKPEEYAFWRDYVPKLTPPWPGKLLSWSMSQPASRSKIAQRHLRPHQERPAPAAQSVALSPHRRTAALRAGRVHAAISPWSIGRRTTTGSAICIEVSDEEAARHLEARQTAQPVPAVLDADRSAALDGGRLARPATAPRQRRHGGRPREVPVHSRVAPHPGRVHRARTARRHRARNAPEAQS